MSAWNSKAGDAIVGEVTSGTFGPTLQKSIAMAYVDADRAAVGTELAVDLKGTPNPAKVVPLPFYKRSGQSAVGSGQGGKLKNED